MQQYFVSEKISIGSKIRLNNDDIYHLRKVLRKGSDYTFRICDRDRDIYLGHLLEDDSCLIDSYTGENNELDHDVTCILSLIKSDKFELCIQKLVELGVKRIVPFSAERSVVKIKDDKKLVRLQKIAREAAEQSHRNLIPEITPVCTIKDLKDYMSEYNYICYESEKRIGEISPKGSITYLIGPEGGFSDKEYEKICTMGFESISLGKRILRAETAAIYMTSIIAEKCQ